MPGKSTTDAALYNCGLKKGIDRVPREELWYSLHKSSILKVYVKVIHNMCDGNITVFKSAVVTT